MSVEDKIKKVEREIKLCTVISRAAAILLVLLFLTEFITAKFFGGAGWAKPVIRFCVYLLYGMPFLVMIPLFFRVNLKGKLYRLKNQK